MSDVYQCRECGYQLDSDYSLNKCCGKPMRFLGTVWKDQTPAITDEMRKLVEKNASGLGLYDEHLAHDEELERRKK